MDVISKQKIRNIEAEISVLMEKNSTTYKNNIPDDDMFRIIFLKGMIDGIKWAFRL